MNLKNKRFLITGASSGIGFEIMKQLLNIEGTRIVAVARNIEKLNDIVGERISPLSVDVAEPANIDKMLDDAAAAVGGIDCLIACAGFAYTERFEGKDYGHIERIFATNVLSPLYTLQRFLEKTEGKVSYGVTSSALGKFGLADFALYCSTKFALDGFADSYRFEKPDRLHYMTVYPMGVKTPFWRHMNDAAPLPKPLQQPEKVAKCIIKGIKKEKRRVFTSVFFKIAWGINRVFPFMFYIYQKMYSSKMKKFEKGHNGG